jgi:uncharacterized protein (UPF0276 family)
MAFRPPRLGPGAIYLRALDRVFRSRSDLIKVAEIEPQTLWTKGTLPGSRPRGNPRELSYVAGLPQRFLTHGVGCPVGGTICDQDMGEFRQWPEQLDAPWTSEHLSILDIEGAAGSQPCGFLMPPLQTDAGVDLARKNIVARAAALGRPFAFETGVNYFPPRDCEMPDGEFFKAVAESADCGILLDLTNLWVNDRNGRAKIADVLAAIPLERVWEIHLAGVEFEHGYWLDAHSRGIDPAVAEIAADIAGSLPNLGAIIFEVAPDHMSRVGEKTFLSEMETLHRIWEKTAPAAVAPARHRTASLRSNAPTPEAWERLIAQHMLPPEDRPRGSGMNTAPSDEQSFSLYNLVSATFRRGAIAELLENTTRLLLIAMGEQALRDFLDRYIAATPPVAFPTDEAVSFGRYMDANPMQVPGLADLLKFEMALIEAAANARTIQITVEKNIDAMVTDLAAGRLPGRSSDLPPTVLEIGVDPAPFVRVLEPQATA